MLIQGLLKIVTTAVDESQLIIVITALTAPGNRLKAGSYPERNPFCAH
jgi:hypothetical protein